MKNQEVTYSNPRVFESSSESQNAVSPEEIQGPRVVGQKGALGILCLLLMMAIAVWLTYVFQCNQENHELKKTLDNLHQEFTTMKNDSKLREEMLKHNKSIEFEALRKCLDSLNRKQNRCFRETRVILDCKQPTGKSVETQGFCCGIKCYYFLLDKKSWNGCKYICQDCSFSILKIDDDDELKFLQLQINPKSYWIGLSYDKSKRRWQWTDDSPLKLDLNITYFNPNKRRCAFLSKTRRGDVGCDEFYHCICERRQ